MSSKKEETYNEFEKMENDLKDYESNPGFSKKSELPPKIGPIGIGEVKEEDEEVHKICAEIGMRIISERKYRKISQTDLSELTEISRPTIGSIEKGKGTLHNFMKVLRALEVDYRFSWWNS